MLDVTLPFDEVALLEQNREYLQRACNLPNTPLTVHQVAAGSDPVPGSGSQPCAWQACSPHRHPPCVSMTASRCGGLSLGIIEASRRAVCIMTKYA